MNIYQCQKKAKKIGFDKAEFMALFPAGPMKCKWLDAYMGLFLVDVEGMRDGFVTVGQIDDMYPDLICSEPFIVDEQDNQE